MLQHACDMSCDHCLSVHQGKISKVIVLGAELMFASLNFCLLAFSSVNEITVIIALLNSSLMD